MSCTDQKIAPAVARAVDAAAFSYVDILDNACCDECYLSQWECVLCGED